MSDTGHMFGCLHDILIVLGDGSKPGLWRDVVFWLLCPSSICSVVLSMFSVGELRREFPINHAVEIG
jgi:hypothetical protein